MPSIARLAPAKPIHPAPIIPPPPQGYMFVTEVEELEEARSKAQREHRIWHSPPVHLGKTLVFHMEKPAGWNELPWIDRMKLKREHLVRECGTHNVWFEEDQRPRCEELIYAFHLDYFASFEVEDVPNSEHQLAETQLIIDWLGNHHRASLDHLTIGMADRLVGALLQQDTTYCAHQTTIEQRRVRCEVKKSSELQRQKRRELHLLNKYRDWMKTTQPLAQSDIHEQVQEQEIQQKGMKQSQPQNQAVHGKQFSGHDRTTVLQNMHMKSVQKDNLLHNLSQTAPGSDLQKLTGDTVASYVASGPALSTHSTLPTQDVPTLDDIPLDLRKSQHAIERLPHQLPSVKRSAPSNSTREPLDSMRPAKKRHVRRPKQGDSERGTNRSQGVPDHAFNHLGPIELKNGNQGTSSQMRMSPSNALIFALPTTLLQTSLERRTSSAPATLRRPPLKFIQTQHRDPVASAILLAKRDTPSTRKRLCNEYGSTILSSAMKKHYHDMTGKVVGLVKLKMQYDWAMNSAYKIDQNAIEKALNHLAVLFHLSGWNAAPYGTVAEAIESFLQRHFQRLFDFKEEPNNISGDHDERSYCALLSRRDEAMRLQSYVLDEANKGLTERHLAKVTSRTEVQSPISRKFCEAGVTHTAPRD